MSIWNVPADVGDLFANGAARYRIIDRDNPGDNVHAMNLFLEAVDVPGEMVEVQDGTQVIVNDGRTRLQIDAGGLGDFHAHGFTVTVLSSGGAS